MDMNKKKVVIGMSGGVDSSVAAALLLKQGYEVIGLTMRLWDDDTADGSDKCSALEDAKRVCESLGIKHYVADFRDSFRQNVIEYFVNEYKNGRTPNPCIICNKFLKFDEMLKFAEELGADYIATGHYARIERDADTGRYLLKEAESAKKDQTYVLYSLTQEQLSKTLMPLGELESKAETRKIAEDLGLLNAKKADSMEICFVPDKDYAAFIERHTGEPAAAGEFVDTEGNVIGRHKGIIHYTVGQRKGLGIAMGRPVFVLDKDAGKNTVVIGDEPELFYKRVEVSGVNFIPFDTLSGELRVKAKLRYRHTEQSATLHSMGESSVLIEFDQPQRAPSPGQVAVFYDGEYVLGGGIIERGIK